jgi:hypothetical protein
MLPAFRQMNRSPGVALQDHVRDDAGVSAGDEEGGGFLVIGQVLEQAGTLGEHVGAKARISFKESLHGLPRLSLPLVAVQSKSLGAETVVV